MDPRDIESDITPEMIQRLKQAEARGFQDGQQWAIDLLSSVVAMEYDLLNIQEAKRYSHAVWSKWLEQKMQEGER